jgi:antagonist of KipI
MSLEIIKPGLFTTVQDLGRPGFQHDGVMVNGPMDDAAHRLANLLVGNDENAAALEITLHGPILVFAGDTLIAVTGADFAVTAAGAPVPGPPSPCAVVLMFPSCWAAAAPACAAIGAAGRAGCSVRATCCPMAKAAPCPFPA